MGKILYLTLFHAKQNNKTEIIVVEKIMRKKNSDKNKNNNIYNQNNSLMKIKT